MLSARCFFFFQAEDGIRDPLVTGVQTCALPISCRAGVCCRTKPRSCGRSLSRPSTCRHASPPAVAARAAGLRESAAQHSDGDVTAIYARWHMFDEKREAAIAIEQA